MQTGLISLMLSLAAQPGFDQLSATEQNRQFDQLIEPPKE